MKAKRNFLVFIKKVFTKKILLYFLLAITPSLLFSDDSEGIRIWRNLAGFQSGQEIPEPLQKMNRHVVRIPGFMVALEMDGQDASEFLLVPAAGLCIHVPPPPPNQTVFVKMESGEKAPFSWEPVWVTGYFEIRASKNHYNSAAYYMLGEKVEDYYTY